MGKSKVRIQKSEGNPKFEVRSSEYEGRPKARSAEAGQGRAVGVEGQEA